MYSTYPVLKPKLRLKLACNKDEVESSRASPSRLPMLGCDCGFAYVRYTRSISFPHLVQSLS